MSTEKAYISLYTIFTMEASIFYYVVFFLFLYCFTKRLLQTKGLPPSPSFSLPIIGHLHLIKRPLHRSLAQLSSQNGPILFLNFGSRPAVLVSSSSAAKDCFTKNNDVIFANRPRFLAGKYLGYDYTTVVWAPYGDHWKNLRRIASHEILSSIQIQRHLGIRMDEVKSLILRLINSSKGGDHDQFQVVEMKSLFSKLSMNVMMRMMVGNRNYEGNRELEEERKFKEIVAESLESSGIGNMVDFIPILKWVGLNKGEKKLATLQSRRDESMQNLIEVRRKSISDSSFEEKNRTIIDALLSLQETDPEYYTNDIIKGMMQVLVSAGIGTSAETMEWALTILLNNPKTLVKAREEIDTVVGTSRLMDESDIEKLPYLRSIINETFRMYPIGPILTRESSEECTVGGFRIPRGTMLLVNIWAIHYDPGYWENPTEFKPERFLGSEAEEKGLILPFGIGRRKCPGEGMAMRLILLAMGCLIQCFEWERIGEEMVDMSEGNGMTMPKAKPLVAKCRPRPAMKSLLSQN